MGWFDGAVARRNAEIAQQGRWRQVRTLAGGGPVTRCVADDRDVVQFASNDYLGLATHPALAEAAAHAAHHVGTGAGASRLIVGGREIHDELELALAAHWSPLLGPRTAALLFPTGFAANLGTLATVVAAGGTADTLVLSDELNHASIIDGARLSRAEVEVFPHADLDALGRLLSRRRRSRAVVVSDMVFSMDGDVADAVALAECCAVHDAVLVLDVAHDAFASLLAVADRVVDTGSTVVVVGTSSKTLGALGGWLVAERATVELALNTARSFIFTTAPSPPDAAAALAALKLLEGDEGQRLRARLRANVDRVAPGHPSPIVPLLLGAEERALEVSAALLEDGLLVPAIRPPTVAEGTCRLRIAVSAEHTPEQLDRLAEGLARAGAPLPGHDDAAGPP
jgi:8-amino-7-oxononanoate synthase